MNEFSLLVVFLLVSTFPHYDCFVISGQSSATADLLEDLLLAKDNEDMKMPEQVLTTFVMGEKYINLDLRKNRNIPSDAPVFVAERGEILQWKSPEDTTFAAYSDHDQEASIVVEERQENGRTFRNFRGTVTVDGQYYLLEPYDSNRQRSTLDDDHLVEIDGIDHVMKMERVDLEFEELFDSFESRSEKKLEEFQERADFRETRAGGFQKYEVEMLLVLDYALYQRWYRSSKASDDKAKKNDAIQNLQYYFSHVSNGVDMRYKNIKESDFSISVRLVGYYVATTAADSVWTERSDIKVTYKNIGYSNMYKALSTLQKWIPEVTPKLGVGFDQATLFSGNNLFDGSYKDDGSPNAKSGLAEIEGICEVGQKKSHARSVSVNRELGVYSSIQTGAHEMGHNLGSMHDGQGNGCLGADQYVMASAPRMLDSKNFENPFKFSRCSVDYFRKYLATLSKKPSGNCLLTSASTVTVNAPANFKPFPGNQYTVDQQCQNIFGLQSYYCAGGGQHEKKLCELMTCFAPVTSTCYASAEQRAYDGTTCGKNMWCMNGKCVHDSKAPSAPESCIYGDYKAVIHLDATTKMTCAEMGKQQPYRCYENRTTLDCCETCAKIVDLKKPKGCQYGDRDPTYCKSRNQKTFCYDPSFAKTCCLTCSQIKGNVPGCEFGDKAPWCIGAKASACYESSTICCETCKKYLQNTPGCEYGDKAPWCATTPLSSALCNHGNTRTQCCAGCKKFKSVREYRDADCLDKADWCSSVFPGWCNDPQTETTCCKTCAGHKTQNPNCPYGDRYDWCKKEFCSVSAKECCKSCRDSNRDQLWLE